MADGTGRIKVQAYLPRTAADGWQRLVEQQGTSESETATRAILDAISRNETPTGEDVPARLDVIENKINLILLLFTHATPGLLQIAPEQMQALKEAEQILSQYRG